MDIGSISAAITSLKAAKDIAQGMIELKSLSDVQSRVIDLQGQILAAQSNALDAQGEQFDLKKRLAELETDLARLLAWEAERGRYDLKEVSPGVFVREVIEEQRGKEPRHWLCCNCFDRGEKSLLQFHFENGPSRVYKCHRCDSEIRVRNAGWSPPPRRNPGGSGSWMSR